MGRLWTFQNATIVSISIALKKFVSAQTTTYLTANAARQLIALQLKANDSAGAGRSPQVRANVPTKNIAWSEAQ